MPHFSAHRRSFTVVIGCGLLAVACEGPAGVARDEEDDAEPARPIAEYLAFTHPTVPDSGTGVVYLQLIRRDTTFPAPVDSFPDSLVIDVRTSSGWEGEFIAAPIVFEETCWAEIDAGRSSLVVCNRRGT